MTDDHNFARIDGMRRAFLSHYRKGLRPPRLQELVRAQYEDATLDEFNAAADQAWEEINEGETR
jgi:hypothetical protein